MSIQRPEALDRIAAALGDRVVVHIVRGCITATCAGVTVQGDTPEAACAALLPALEYQGDDLVPELQLRFHHLDLSLQQVSHRGDRTGYGEVRNTRVTQPDAFALDYLGAFDLGSSRGLARHPPLGGPWVRSGHRLVRTGQVLPGPHAAAD